ncbi:MAG: bifunctional DNA primase/polymerase [Anaerolineae bacterium]
MLTNFNDIPTILTAAEAYTAFGYAVIPLLADRDSSRPKVPAVPWAAFQHRHPDPDELRQWFLHDAFSGIGIVTGRVSHLVVLDFDNEEVLNHFQLRCPDLMATRSVRSAGRGLLHLYFHLPPRLSLPSQKGQGIDLLSDGRYVVAPPTTINGQAYTLVRGGIPKTLSERDLQRLQSFLRQHAPTTRPVLLPEPQQQTTHTVGTALLPSEEFPKPNQADVTALYRYHCQHGGRNEALFRTSLFARDNGWTQTETHGCLVPLHAHQPAGDCSESTTQRQREAAATVRSAFSRSARHKQRRTASHQLSNSVREALVQRKLTYVVRTIEGLLQAGLRPGQVFTTEQAITLLKGTVGRDSIYNALRTRQQGRALFNHSPPAAPHQDASASAENTKLLKSKKCFFDTEQKSGKIVTGRHQRRFILPHNLDLCRLFGVRASASDPLQPADLASARQTRMALHRELIKRRPGPYPRRWLAARLGVTRRTIDAYNQLIPIHSKPVYLESSLNWGTIERLPLTEALQGAFVETAAGKQYPALRSIAARLLAAGQRLRLKQRTVNYYWYGDAEPTPTVAATYQEEPHTPQAHRETISQPPPTIRPQLPVPTVNTRPAVQCAHKPDFHRPLPDTAQEGRAVQLYSTFSQTSGKQLSMANARRLVHLHPPQAISNALNLTEKRKQVTNPVGFFITALRSTP